MPEVSALYAGTRRALLDALDALEGQRDAFVLVGAQAVFLHTGETDEAIATETKDADLAVNPSVLAEDPLIETAMQAAGFHLDLEHPQPGSWLSREGYPVDILVPNAVSGREGKGRAGRIPPHDEMSTRRVAGIEAALVDNAPMTISALTPDDSRRYAVNVAGPAALLIAKIHKVAERRDQPKRQRPRDSHDIFRLLREVEPEKFAAGFAVALGHEVSAKVAQRGLGYLEELFGGPEAFGAQQVAQAVEGLVADEQILAIRASALAREVLEAINR